MYLDGIGKCDSLTAAVIEKSQKKNRGGGWRVDILFPHLWGGITLEIYKMCHFFLKVSQNKWKVSQKVSHGKHWYINVFCDFFYKCATFPLFFNPSIRKYIKYRKKYICGTYIIIVYMYIVTGGKSGKVAQISQTPWFYWVFHVTLFFWKCHTKWKYYACDCPQSLINTGFASALINVTLFFEKWHILFLTIIFLWYFIVYSWKMRWYLL